MHRTDIHPLLEAYRADLEDDTVISRRKVGDDYSIHSAACTCGCLPVTQAQATEAELGNRGLWRCVHGTRWPHECRECIMETPQGDIDAWVAAGMP